MSRYKMDDGRIVDTDKAVQSWRGHRYFDGNNYISVHTGSQWNHEVLHKTLKGNYYIERYSDWQGSRPSAEWVDKHEAVAWLTLNEDQIPDDLKELVKEVVE